VAVAGAERARGPAVVRDGTPTEEGNEVATVDRRRWRAPPGEWQSLDVLWQGPRLTSGGSILTRPGRLTALLNGVVVQKRL